MKTKIFLLFTFSAVPFFIEGMGPLALRRILHALQNAPVKLFRYADLTIVNETDYPIAVNRILTNGEYAMKAIVFPKEQHTITEQNMDMLKSLEISYREGGGTKLEIPARALETKLTLLDADVALIFVRSQWNLFTGWGFQPPEIVIIPGPEEVVFEGDVERVVPRRYTPEREKEVLYETIGVLQGKTLTPSSPAYAILGFTQPPPRVESSEQLMTDPVARIYAKDVNENYTSLDKKIRDPQLARALQSFGITRPQAKLVQIVRSARDVLKEQLKA